jgi:hypothetical protein
MESLETRRLLAGEPWGAIPRLVRLDRVAEEMPLLSGSGQTVAVIDSGIDYRHPALGGGFGPQFKVIDGWDFVQNDADPLDTHGHGTAIAGIIAADEFVSGGFRNRGVAPGAKLVALRVHDGASAASDATMEAALQWVISNRQRLNITVVNLSLGYGHFTTSTANPTFGDELVQLAAANVTLVASSGNGTISSGPGMMYPAIDPVVIAVAAVDRFDIITEFSARSEKLELLAPGVDVPTLGLSGAFATAEGTSFAAPFVSGTVALLREIDPTFARADIVSALRVAGTDNFDGDDEFGTTTRSTFPRLDIFSSVRVGDLRRQDANTEALLLGAFGNNNDLQRDEYGLTHFAWFDSADRTLKYAVRSSAGNWSRVTAPDTTNIDMGQYVSMAFDQRGRPAMAYFDGFNGDLRFARWTRDDWSRETVDSRFSVGLYPSLTFNAANQPLIAYYYKTGGDLRLASFGGMGWGISTIDSDNDVGRSGSLARDRAGNLAIAYEDSTSGHLKLARLQAGAWTKSVVDDSTRGVAFISLAFDSLNQPAISYYDAFPADLKFASIVNNTWQRTVLSTRGAVGLYSRLWLDQSDLPRVLYFNRTRNQLLETRRLANGTWESSLVRSAGGRYLSGLSRTLPDGSTEFIFSYYDSSNRRLRIDTRT